jgi:hypothetical protein
MVVSVTVPLVDNWLSQWGILGGYSDLAGYLVGFEGRGVLSMNLLLQLVSIWRGLEGPQSGSSRRGPVKLVVVEKGINFD